MSKDLHNNLKEDNNRQNMTKKTINFKFKKFKERKNQNYKD